ncbi:MAG: hypothetical protein AB7E61_07100 [Acholeplasmataceae bacterium]
MEQNQEKVLINLEEYKDFVIGQYEQGKLKTTLTQEIKELQAQKNSLIEELKDARNSLQSQGDTILELCFNRSRMENNNDTRKEMTQTYTDGSYGSYFGFDESARKGLLSLGFTQEQMVDYVNKQWDKKEADEAAKKAGEENE